MTAVRDGEDGDLPAARAIAEATLDLDQDDAAQLPALLWAEDPGTARVRLVAVDGDRVAGVLLGSLQGEHAYLDLVDVAPAAQGRGVGRALLHAWEERATAAGAAASHVGENLHTYAWPGVDIRYTGAVAMLMRAGYTRTRIAYNMDRPLPGPDLHAAQGVARLADQGVEVRRGRAEDVPAVGAYMRRQWTDVWFRETRAALLKDPPSIFLAFRDGAVVGFAAHGIHRPCLYGPIGTDPAEQGRGIGAVLSALCLTDMAARGVPVAEICWVAEAAIPFYSRTAGARLGRCFWMMTKPLGTKESRG